MKKIFYLLLFVVISASLFAQSHYDLVIVGGNPGGITAAISAARLGKKSLILERTHSIGGLPANGLGATDIATRKATTGLFREFVDRVKQYYIDTYGPESEQVKMCSDGYHFEPSVGAKVFDEMLGEYKDYITILTMRQFDASDQNIVIEDKRIRKIEVMNRNTGEMEEYSGEVFIDATYEGDLGAAARLPFRVGREGQEEFDEPGAGRIYKYWRGPEAEGSTFQQDNAVQAYNYRLCLTNDPDNRVDFRQPENYNRNEYLSLIEDVWSGRNTNAKMMNVTPEMIEENRLHIRAGNRTKLPGDIWGVSKITNLVHVPNKKTDGNNQHDAFLSTDLPEENWPWPTSSWEWRDKFAVRLREYTEGLFWFAQSDPELPEHFRKAVKEWGLAKDEYVDNGHFPRQVYVREGRRFEGLYFFTAQDALPVEEGGRPPVHAESITASHYALDSHAVRKREEGRVHLDGFLSYPTAVYTVPFGIMVPKEIVNLLLPVPVSGSHIGFSTLRMEPCWMAIGQAAGISASIAMDDKKDIQSICIEKLQKELINQQATLIYYQDVSIDHPSFAIIQYMGLRGYLKGWKADPDALMDKSTLTEWEQISQLDLSGLESGNVSRLQALEYIYRQLK